MNLFTSGHFYVAIETNNHFQVKKNKQFYKPVFYFTFEKDKKKKHSWVYYISIYRFVFW